MRLTQLVLRRPGQTWCDTELKKACQMWAMLPPFLMS